MITRLMFEAAIGVAPFGGEQSSRNSSAIESRHGLGANSPESPLSPLFCCRPAVKAGGPGPLGRGRRSGLAAAASARGRVGVAAGSAASAPVPAAGRGLGARELRRGRRARGELDDSEANDTVGDPQHALQVGQQRGRPMELQQVVLGVGAVADLVRQGAVPQS